jgi:hypothetical protein
MVTEERSLLAELLQYYEVRMLALSEYSDRVWNRFNWFMTVEVATFGFFFSQAESVASQSILRAGVPGVGAVIALLWILMGAEDFVSLGKHGRRTKEVERQVQDAFRHQGATFEAEAQRGLKFRQTWLLFLFPSLVALAWAVVFVSMR